MLIVYKAIVMEQTKNDWWIDSNATQHVFMSRAYFMKINYLTLGEHKLY